MPTNLLLKVIILGSNCSFTIVQKFCRKFAVSLFLFQKVMDMNLMEPVFTHLINKKLLGAIVYIQMQGISLEKILTEFS